MRLSTSISCRYSSVDDLLQESIHLVIIRAKFLTSPFFHTISFWIFKLTFFTKFIFRPFTLSFCYTVVVATLFVIFVIGVLIHNFIFSHSHLIQYLLGVNYFKWFSHGQLLAHSGQRWWQTTGWWALPRSATRFCRPACLSWAAPSREILPSLKPRHLFYFFFQFLCLFNFVRQTKNEVSSSSWQATLSFFGIWQITWTWRIIRAFL